MRRGKQLHYREVRLRTLYLQRTTSGTDYICVARRVERMRDEVVRRRRPDARVEQVLRGGSATATRSPSPEGGRRRTDRELDRAGDRRARFVVLTRRAGQKVTTEPLSVRGMGPTGSNAVRPGWGGGNVSVAVGPRKGGSEGPSLGAVALCSKSRQLRWGHRNGDVGWDETAWRFVGVMARWPVAGGRASAPDAEQPQVRGGPWGCSKGCRRRPTLPRSRERSTIGAVGLNDRVRNGNECGPDALVASDVHQSR